MAEQDNEQTTAVKERLEQTVTVEPIGPARKQLTIEIPESRIKAKTEDTYKQLANDAAIPGFRRGRAPRRLIEKRFGSSLHQDVKGHLVSESYTQAVEDEKLDVLGEPDIKDLERLEIPESGPLTLKVEIEVTPEVTLPAFNEIRVQKKKTAVTVKNVSEEIERLRERLGRMVEARGAKIKSNDFVRVDVRILAGDQAGDDADLIAHHPDTHVLVHGKDLNYKGHVAGILVDDLGKRLTGKTAGDQVEISVTGPAGHEDEKIKDQPVTLKLRIETVERLEPAAVEEVAAQIGADSQDQLKKQIRQLLEQRHEQQQQADLHRQVCDQLAERIELELPEGLTARQTTRLLRRRQMELSYRDASEEEIQQQLAEMRTGSEAETRAEMKRFFILTRAAEQLNIEVTEAEINGRIAMMGMQQGRRPEKLRQQMQRRGEIDTLYLQLREQKTLDKILDQAQVTETKSDKPAKKSSARSTKGSSKDKAAGPTKAG